MKDTRAEVNEIEADRLRRLSNTHASDSRRNAPTSQAPQLQPISALSRDDSTFSLSSHGWSSSTPTLPPYGSQQWESRPPSPVWTPGADSGQSTPIIRENAFSMQPLSQVGFSSATNLLSKAPSPVLRQAPVKGGTGIAQLHERDDIDTWKGWRRNVFHAIPLFTCLNVVFYVTYLVFRIVCVSYAQNEAGEVYYQAWVFIAIEFLVAVPPLAHNTWTMWAVKKRGRPKMRLVGEDVPNVDILITCCREEDEVIIDTVNAACNQDYPRNRFRVIVLDDGKSSTLEKAMGSLSTSYPNIYYVARPKEPGKPHNFKAGNLNFGLEYTNSLPGGAGYYMAALDADMIAEPHWLRAMLPHLTGDPKVAMACPPQLFYNTPRGDPLSQSLDFFVHVIEPIKDALGVAWCTGSGYVVRRDALSEIGNFPLGSLAEDVSTSTMLLGRGWKTAYVHEALQFGTVPQDYGGHLKQRTRWAIGTVDTSVKLNFCLFGDKVKHMSFPQRFSGFLYATLNLYTIMLTVSLFAIPIILIMGRPLVAYATDEQLRWLIRSCFAAFMTNRICELILSMPAGYRVGRRGSRYELWMSPYIALCIVRSFVLPKWLGGQTQAFDPSGSLNSALSERDATQRKGLFRRVWSILFHYCAFYHLAFVYFTLVAVVLTSFRCFVYPGGLRETGTCLVTHAFWPPLAFVFICSSLWTPISYAIDPPVMPDREQLLERDPKTGVAHPTAASKKIAFGGEDAWYEMEYTVITVFTTFVFVLSFIY